MTFIISELSESVQKLTKKVAKSRLVHIALWDIHVSNVVGHRECTVYIFQVQVTCQDVILNIAKGLLSSSIPLFLWDTVYINALSLSQRLINPGWRITLRDQYPHIHTYRYRGTATGLLSIMEDFLNTLYPVLLSRHYHERKRKMVV